MDSQLSAADLDFYQLDYFRCVAVLAALVNGGADLRKLTNAARFVTNPSLAVLVLQFTKAEQRVTPAALTLPADPRFDVFQLLARYCLQHDVLRCLAFYFDEQLADSWAAQIAEAA
jgi:hypothetical protein